MKQHIQPEDMRRRLLELEAENETLRLEIADFKAASEKSAQNEARLLALIENIPVLIHAHDDDMNYVFWNKESELVTGYPREVVLNNSKAMSLLYPDRDQSEFQALMNEHSAQDYRDMEMPIRCADGQTRIVAWSNISRSLPIAGWRAWEIGVDVTDKVFAFKELRESEKRWRKMLDVSPDAIILHDDLLIQYTNQAALRLFSHESIVSFVQTTWRNLFNFPQDIPQDCTRDSIQLKGSTYLKNLGIHVEITSTLMELQDRTFTLTMIRNISGQKRYERELVRSRNILRAFIDSTEDYFVLIDGGYTIKACNLSSATAVKRQPREVVGKNLLSFMPRLP